jgi:penicillin-binding protein 1A
MVSAYAVFANGGYKVSPYIVREIRDKKDQLLAHSAEVSAGDEALRVIDPRNAFLMDMMLRDVTIYGTAARASVVLKRQDLAGKTGTTNEYVDAWFCGYQMTVAGCAWVGFDQPKKLGNKETGGSAALPIWIGYMNRALKDVPVQLQTTPDGLVAYGEGRERNYVYTENMGNIPVADEVPASALPPSGEQIWAPSD